VSFRGVASLRALARLTAVLIAVTLVGSLAAVAAGGGHRTRVRATGKLTAAPVAHPTTTLPPTTEAPTTEPPTTVADPATSGPPADALAAQTPQFTLPAVVPGAPLPAPGAFTLDPYAGLGTWLDVYDWSETYGGGAVGLADIDRIASLGVQTVYVQATRWDAATPVLEPDRLVALINRARADGMRVVAWYLPDLGDPNDDFQRLIAIARLPIDGLAVDIESRKVPDVNDRNQRLLALSAELRQQLPGQVLSAIVLPPVVMEDVNPNYWPDYPWAGLAPYYDVWQPMSYWTNRIGGWRDAYTYTATNIDRVRDHIGNPNAIVHPIGGIGDTSTPDDIAGMTRAAVERGCIGGSVYDYRTTGDDLWAPLQGLRSG